MRFCDKLAKQRKNNNLSQEQLADKLGVSRQAVSKWESGTSYPDMDKMIQLCKALNCTLDELMDDGTIKPNQNKETKVNFNSYIQEFLNFLTKTSNMLTSMGVKEKLKCIGEMFFISLMLLTVGGIAYAILNSITGSIFRILPFGFEYILEQIFSQIYIITILILGFIIFIHLFKVRYLDYFITIEDKNVKEKVIEEPIDGKKTLLDNKNQKEKIIIRDPKHSSFNFFTFLGQIILFFIKIFTLFFAVPVIIMFLLFTVLGVISLCHTIYGIIFIFIALVLLSCSAICYVLINFIYNFIFNRPIAFKKMFNIFVISLTTMAASAGITFVCALNYKFENTSSNMKTVTDTKYINIDTNTNFYSPRFKYIIDNSLTNAKIEITHPKDINYVFDSNEYIDEENGMMKNYYIYG